MSNKYLDTFDFEYFYHVYSHGNGTEVLFAEEKNYHYFLQKIKKYILPITEIHAYCLMPNHFHLLLRFREKETVIENLELEEDIEDAHKFLMQKFSNMLNSYTKAFNKLYHRRGALFLDYIKRKNVNDEKYLLKVLHYIHNNPVEAELVSDCQFWKHSSFNAYLNSGKKSDITRDFINDFFDDKESFVKFHKSNVEYPELEF